MRLKYAINTNLKHTGIYIQSFNGKCNVLSEVAVLEENRPNRDCWLVNVIVVHLLLVPYDK